MRLPVAVSGKDATGQPFTVSANVSEVSNLGVRLEGVGSLVQPGDTITVTYRRSYGHFRVVWRGQPGTRLEGQTGLQNLEPAKRVFGIGWPSPAPDTYQVPGTETSDEENHPRPAEQSRMSDRRQQERRRFPRHSCVETAEIHKANSAVQLWGKLTDISMGGCYIEMMSPFPAETEVSMMLKVGPFRFRAHGSVAVMHACMGMGIAFTEISPSDYALLQRAIGYLAGETKELEETPGNGRIDAHKAIDSIRIWFAAQDTLTRDQFHTLLQKSSDHSCEEDDMVAKEPV